MGGVSQPLGFGAGQSWKDVTASRVIGTTYTNTTGRPIQVAVTVSAVPYFVMLCYVNGVQIQYQNSGGAGYSQACSSSFIVPPGATYMVNVTAGTYNTWMELS